MSSNRRTNAGRLVAGLALTTGRGSTAPTQAQGSGPWSRGDNGTAMTAHPQLAANSTGTFPWRSPYLTNTVLTTDDPISRDYCSVFLLVQPRPTVLPLVTGLPARRRGRHSAVQRISS